MDTEWTDGDNVWYLRLKPRGVDKHEFDGAYGAYSRCVYRRNGTQIQTLPDGLILDEALAVAKIIIMTERNTHDPHQP